MRKLFFAAIIIACAAPFTFAQSSGDYNKVEFFGGYSHNRVDTGINADDDPELSDIVSEREGFNGFEASITGNLSRYVGLKGDFSFHRKSFSDSFGTISADVDADLFNFLGGVQIKDNSKETKVKPFAHALVGAAHDRIKATVTGISGLDTTDTDTGFAAAFGGGLDFRVNDRIDFRAVQFDYNPTRLGGETQHNFRVGIGLVIH